MLVVGLILLRDKRGYFLFLDLLFDPYQYGISQWKLEDLSQYYVVFFKVFTLFRYRVPKL